MPNEKNTALSFLIKVLQGMLIGAGGILPGISGGSFALSFGIYASIMSFIAHPFKNFWANVKLLLPYGIGGVIGFLLAGKLLAQFFKDWEGEMIFLFIGCIVGTLPFLFKDTVKTGKAPRYYIAAFLAFVIGMVLILFVGDNAKTGNIEQVATSTTITTWYIWIIAGVIIGLGTLIPGTSASIVLMYFGWYPSLLAALSPLNIHVLGCAAIGVGTVVLLFSKAIDYIFKTKKAVASWAVLGLVLSSVLIIVSAFPKCKTSILPYVLFAVGAIVSWIFEKLAPSEPAE